MWAKYYCGSQELKLNCVESSERENVYNFELAEQRGTVGMNFCIYYRSQNSLLE